MHEEQLEWKVHQKLTVVVLLSTTVNFQWTKDCIKTHTLIKKTNAKTYLSLLSYTDTE